MPFRFLTLMGGVCLLAALAGPTVAADPESVQADEKTLKAASLSSEGPALLEFFRKRTLADTYRNKILGLINKMGDDSFQVREQAFADLLALGPAAAPLLRQAQQTSSDIEIVRRAERCLELIEKNHSTAIASAATRLLAVRRPEGTAEVLLDYLPFADDETVIDEIRNTLRTVGFADGKPDKALLEAIEDKLAVRRGVAGDVLVRSGSDEQRETMRKLLKDTDPTVRLRVGLALVERKDKEAMPSLIGLLADGPRDQCWRIEDILYRLAGEAAPAVSLGTTDAARRKCRDAWSDWWTQNGARIDLAKLDEQPPHLGLTLYVEMTQGVNGRVREVGRDGKTRWEIGGLQYPIDAQVVGPDRVLIVEYTPRRVTERDTKGKVIWQRNMAATAYPMGVQRLPNGNTLIATRNQLLEVDREGKNVSTHNRAGNDIMAGAKTRDGQFVVITRNACVRLDAKGKEIRSFPIGPVQTLGTNVDILPNGNLLVPQTTTNKVVEYTPEGKAVWEVTVANPTSVERLPNGNTLIGSMATQQVIEVDRSGKAINQFRGEGARLMRVRQR
jgi:hypothetical protein